MSYSAEVGTARVDYSLVGTILRLVSEVSVLSGLIPLFSSSIIRIQSLYFSDTSLKKSSKSFQETRLFADYPSKLSSSFRSESYVSLDALIKSSSTFRTEVLNVPETVIKRLTSFLFASHLSQDIVLKRSMLQKLESISLLEVPRRLVSIFILAGNAFQDIISKLGTSLKSEVIGLTEVLVRRFASLKNEIFTSLEIVSKKFTIVKQERGTFIDTMLKTISTAITGILLISDYFVRIWQIFLTSLETSTFVESLVKRIQSFRLESIVLALFRSLTSRYLRTFLESNFLIDVPSKILSILRISSLTVIDYISTTKTFLRTVFESIMLSSYSTLIISLSRVELIAISEFLWKQFMLLKGELQALVDSLKNFVASMRMELYQLQESTLKLARLLKTEIIILGDYFLRLWQVFLFATESLKLSDIASKIHRFLLQQPFTLTSVVYTMSSLLRSLVESSLFAEVTRKQIQGLRRESLSVVDFLSRTIGTLLILLEQTALSVVTRSLFISFRSELTSFGEAIVKQVKTLRTELSIFSDSLIRFVSTLRTQVVVLADNVLKLSIVSRFESLAFTIANVYFVGLVCLQAISLTEESRRSLRHILTPEIITLVDTLTNLVSSLLTETFSSTAVIVKSIKTALVGEISLLELLLKRPSSQSLELISIYDYRVTKIVKVCAEASVLVDLLGTIVTYVRCLVSTISLVESVIALKGILFWYFESINLSEQMDRTVSFHRLVSEAISVIEQRTTYFLRVLAQSLSLFSQIVASTVKHAIQEIHLEDILSKSYYLLQEAELVLTEWLSFCRTFLLCEYSLVLDSLTRAIASLRTETLLLSPLVLSVFVRIIEESLSLVAILSKKAITILVEILSTRDIWFKQWLSSRVLLELLIVRELTRSVMKKVLREIVVYLELLNTQFTFIRVYTYAVKLPLSISRKIYTTLKQKYSTKLKERKEHV